jgi:hypothetical protein
MHTMRRRILQKYDRFRYMHTVWNWNVLYKHGRDDGDDLPRMSGQFKLSEYECRRCLLHVQRGLRRRVNHRTHASNFY